MTEEEAKRILFEKPGQPWQAEDVLKLLAEIERLNLLIKSYQADAHRRYGPPVVYTSGGTSVGGDYKVYQ